MMVQALAACALGVAMAASEIPAPQAASIPLALAVTATPNELTAGGTARVDVRLKNYLGSTVNAPERIVVTLHSELSGDVSVGIEAGESGAQTHVRFARAGLARLVATAPNMTSGFVAVAVNAAAAQEPASKAAPADQPVALVVDVLPDHMHPSNAVWQGKVLVTAVDDARQPMRVPAATTIQLSADAGTVSPDTVTIAAGHARATTPITLTSTKPGTGTLYAWTDSGDLFRAAVEYHNPVATQLAVKALPTHTLNDGRTAINVTVFLQDEGSGNVNAEDDVQVKLTSSVGTLMPSVISVPKGRFVAETMLTSATAGVAEVTASAAGLRSGLTTVEFVFPYVLVVVAAAGGLLGALVRSRGETFTGSWPWQLSGSLGIGAVLGLLFYLLAAFGIVASIPKVALPLDRLPTSNEFAALVLGFFGGYYARAWIPNQEAVSAQKRQPEHV
jgi:hypothetical protein